ncbi:PD-(D/E)XK motif protein [Thioalkalivibrio sp. AKL6]|uniref:PD-(D/E)XK motif protein n=1 Tax=Thioalkalivibrio sp. AKL6 TaxID=1158154 RepID=UPI000368F5D9|nr:PD-(D/E)XK motif protein [Thioalkalivibrio sp. AKL6]
MTSEYSGQLPARELLWIWERLTRRVGEDDKPVFEPADEHDHDALLLGLGEAGVPRAMVPVEPDHKRASDLSSKNVVVDLATVWYGGRKLRVLRLTCTEPRLHPVFAELVSDIHRRLLQGRSGAGAVRNAVGDFRKLLEAAPAGDVTREEAAGLAGELMVLMDLMRLAPDAWNAWEGPLGGEHDFHRNERSLEVKSSTRREPSSVEIHGIRQLEAPSGGLHLVHQILVPDPQGEISVPDLVDGLYVLAPAAPGLSERLGASGYSETIRQAWEMHRFNPGKRTIFTVGEDFPRITPDRLKSGETDPGIDSVQFSLRLDALDQWAVADEERSRVMEEFLHEG